MFWSAELWFGSRPAILVDPFGLSRSLYSLPGKVYCVANEDLCMFFINRQELWSAASGKHISYFSPGSTIGHPAGREISDSFSTSLLVTDSLDGSSRIERPVPEGV